MPCPCLLADEPCRPDCSCVNPLMSCGCLCCCTYGSPEQQKRQANRLVTNQKRTHVLCVGKHGEDNYWGWDLAFLVSDIFFLVSSEQLTPLFQDGLPILASDIFLLVSSVITCPWRLSLICFFCSSVLFFPVLAFPTFSACSLVIICLLLKGRLLC